MPHLHLQALPGPCQQFFGGGNRHLALVADQWSTYRITAIRRVSNVQ
jgi:hypothetical protein